MNIFITGINGVLGSVLAKELRLRGHYVAGCDLAHSSDPNIIRADIAERRQLTDALQIVDGHSTFNPTGHGIDLVYHFAAEFGRHNGQFYYEDLWRTNCIGTRNVIEECHKRGIPMVFSSSSEAYGMSELYANGSPLQEEMLDDFAPQFHTEYALSKWTNERQIFTAVRNNGLKAIVLRFFNVYGPPERFSPFRSVVSQFTWNLLNGLPLTVNLEGKRSHLWIGDWVRTVANIATLDRLREFHSDPTKVWLGAGGTPGVPVFNIGGTEYEPISELYKRILDAARYVRGVGLSEPIVRYQKSEMQNSATKESDNTLATLFLGHNPTMPLNKGLLETVKWMEKIRQEGLT